jgi:acetolactate synthase-1/2/3 large subunit
MFGMGGFQLLPFYEACRTLGVRHMLINDERCGAFAADAYARVTNRPGLVDGTLGPGATNLATGLAEAFNAGMPMVAVIGDANRPARLEEHDAGGAAVRRAAPAGEGGDPGRGDLPHPRARPARLRRSDQRRPGPVLLAVPEDVAHGEHEFDAASSGLTPARCARRPAACARVPRTSARAAALLARAERPLILAGGGIHISEAQAALTAFAEAQGIPVAHTMSGKGAIACTHALSAGVFGRYSRIANDLIAMSDCLLVLGCKLGEIATKRFTLMPPGVPLIHVDIMPEEIGRTTRTEIALVGDARATIADLAEALRDRGQRAASRAGWCAEVPRRMAEWREGARERLESVESPINVGRLLGELNRIMPADAVLVADGGFAAHWGALFHDTKQAGRGFVADRGFASIGYGVPGGIGAQLGVGKARRVVSLTGDGGFNMSMGELETAKRAGAAFVCCIFNNAASGYVKALQHAVYGPGNYQSSDLVEMDYAGIARAMGCHGIRVTDPEKLNGALREGLANTDTPTILDIVVTRDPARMLPAADNRTLTVQKGDRPV